MKSLRIGLAVMMATAAVVPLVTYGVVSVYTLRVGTRQSVTQGNLNVARQVGEQVRRYVSTNLQIFQALAADMEETGLSVEQQDRILKNFALRFPEFRELTVFDAAERQVASSRVGPADTRPPRPPVVTVLGVTMSPVVVDADMLPATVVELQLGRDGDRVRRLVGQFSIEELWRVVGRIRIGAHGVVLLVGADGELLAHGNPEDRIRVARGENVAMRPIVRALRESGGTDPVVLDDGLGAVRPMVTVGVRIPELDWLVLVEQPADEAFALARRQERELIAAASLALLIVIVVGAAWGRTLIRPIDALIGATQTLAAGNLDARVEVTSHAEIGRLGTAFNTMADRLARLQEDVRRQERHAMFGRVAAGLVHDLSHPFKNVQNNCRLMLKMYDDAEYRELFQRTIDREFSTIRRVFEDLRNIAKPMPLERFPLDLSKLVSDVGEAMRANTDVAGLALDLEIAPGDLYVEGDMFALGRVCRNLMVNAIEATPPQGRVSVSTEEAGGRARLTVRDTGCGIAPERLEHLFEDFATTKRQGLGLGLAICRKIVEQLGGTIAVSSEVGKGTAFVVEFPAVPKPPQAPQAESIAAG